jgi:adenylate kinase
MDKGELVPDSVVLGMVEERLKQDDCVKGYVLDGFPRNTKQAEALDGMLTTMNMSLSAALSVDVPFDDLMKRLTGRRTCKACGQMFNIYFNAPRSGGVCDKCGGDLFQRDDDRQETIKKRLEVYNAQTAPLIDYYRKKNILKSVAGMGTIEDIFGEVCKVLDLK